MASVLLHILILPCRRRYRPSLVVSGPYIPIFGALGKGCHGPGEVTGKVAFDRPGKSTLGYSSRTASMNRSAREIFRLTYKKMDHTIVRGGRTEIKIMVRRVLGRPGINWSALRTSSVLALLVLLTACGVRPPLRVGVVATPQPSAGETESPTTQPLANTPGLNTPADRKEGNQTFQSTGKGLAVASERFEADWPSQFTDGKGLSSSPKQEERQARLGPDASAPGQERFDERADTRSSMKDEESEGDTRSDREDRPEIPMVLNARVEWFIRYFTGVNRSVFAKWLERSTRYTDMMRRILREEEVPEDLVYIALIESGFNPKAYSWAGASGPWQFMRGTARKYGLRVNWWIDERRDPVKSTRAAARYFKFLHGTFQSWYLAQAGYNAGEGKIQRGLSRLKKKDFCLLSYLMLRGLVAGSSGREMLISFFLKRSKASILR